MLKTILQSGLRSSTRYSRLCSCWCPQEPIDPNTKIAFLNNGVRIATEENLSPLACVSLFVVAGPRYEPARHHGLTHFIEHLAYKGFITISRQLLEDSVLSMGAKMTVKTKRDMQIFSVLLPSTLVLAAVESLFEIVYRLELDECEMEKERYNLCLQLMDADRNPTSTMFDYLHAAAFQGTPLAQTVMGPSHNISRFDKTVTSTFMKEHYTTCRMILATSGAVSHDQILSNIGSTFGKLTSSGVADCDLGPCRFTGSEVIYRDDSMPFAHVAIAVEAPGYNSPDYPTMFVMNCLMGTWDRSQGRPYSMTHEVSIHEPCERYEPFYIVYKDVGLWGVHFVADRRKLDVVVGYTQDEWMNMTISCHEKQVARAVNIAKMKVAKRYDGVINSSRDIGMQVMYGCTRRPLEVLLNQVSAVKWLEIRDMGEKYLYNKTPVVVGIGPTESLPAFTRIESGMYWLKW